MSQSKNAVFDATADMQKKWAESIQEVTAMMSKMGVGSPGNDPYAAAKLWNEGAGKILEQSLEGAQDGSPMPAALKRLMKLIEVLSKLMGFGEKLTNTLKSAGTKTNVRSNAAADKAQGLFEKAMHWTGGKLPMSHMPESASAWQRVLMGSFVHMSDFTRDMARRAGEGLDQELPTPTNMKNFYASWLSRYEKTVGRFVNITMVGPSRYEAEKLEKSTDAYMKYQAASMDFHSKMVQTGVEAMQEVAEESADILSDDVSEESLEKFHNMLMAVGERRYHDLFKSEFFSRSLKSLVNTGLDLHKSSNDVIEQGLRNTPVVTQTQADEIHKEVYLLKKRMAAIEGKFNGEG